MFYSYRRTKMNEGNIKKSAVSKQLSTAKICTQKLSSSCPNVPGWKEPTRVKLWTSPTESEYTITSGLFVVSTPWQRTSGPQTFSGTEVENCEQRSITQFQPIPTNLPKLSAEDIDTDQKYLYKIINPLQQAHFLAI